MVAGAYISCSARRNLKRQTARRMKRQSDRCYLVAASLLIDQSEELEEVQVFVAEHRRLVDGGPWWRHTHTILQS